MPTVTTMTLKKRMKRLKVQWQQAVAPDQQVVADCPCSMHVSVLCNNFHWPAALSKKVSFHACLAAEHGLKSVCVCITDNQVVVGNTMSCCSGLTMQYLFDPFPNVVHVFLPLTALLVELQSCTTTQTTSLCCDMMVSPTLACLVAPLLTSHRQTCSASS